MSKAVTVHKYTDNAVADAKELTKEQYKKVKHMDKIQLTNLLRRIYKRGYQDALSVIAAQEQQEGDADSGGPEE